MASSNCRYSGLSTLRKLARHQIMKTWPTFSSTVILRSVFSAHLSPADVCRIGLGRECFSFAKADKDRAMTRRMGARRFGIAGNDSRRCEWDGGNSESLRYSDLDANLKCWGHPRSP